jgi:mediator of RNA polymerase II transcription subunit 17
MSQLSFQPWPLEKPQSPNIIEVLDRVRIERGQLFRNVTEASLQEEIATDGDLSPEQSLSEDEEEEDADNDKELGKQAKNDQPVTREELQRAKFEMLQQVAIAHNEIMMAVDFVSLLESEHATHAQQSMSVALKQAVPSKTLGTDMWEHMPVDEARLAQDRLLARNVKMRSLQQSADNILGAAKRLEDNVRKETQFWDQMLSISSKGWSICRLPKSKGLGVRYGFSESSAEFSKRDIAALNSNKDGSVSLDRGFGTKPTGLKVTVSRNGQVVGKSSLPSISDDSETTLEARIRHARDSIFDEELFREMTRESRTMASLGVAVRGHTITIPASTVEDPGSTEIHIELAPLDDEIDSPNSSANPDDAIAQAMALGARLILSQAHRDKLSKRSEVPQPMAERNEERPVMSILTPLASFLLHKTSLNAVNSYIARATSVLSLAGIDVTASRAVFELPQNNQITNTTDLVSMLKSTMVSTGGLKFKTSSHTVDIAIQVESSLAQTQNMNSNFTLTTPDDRSLRFDAVEDVVQSADAAIASSLATALASRADGNWIQDQREALLVLDEEDQDERKSVWMALDSQKGRLVLGSLQKDLVWEDGGDLPGVGLWDAWSKMV